MVRRKDVATKCAENKFNSTEAKARYDSVFNEKSFIHGKGFHPAFMDGKHGISTCSQMVAALKWDKFCAPRNMPESDIVREFYSNLWVTQATDVHVCGTVVPFSTMAISKFFLVTKLSSR